MTTRQNFQKALMLLDRGAIERSEEVLRQVVNDSASERDVVTLVQGLVCLGDLLYETGRRSEARPFLERALHERRDDDLLAKEFEIARNLLSKMSGN